MTETENLRNLSRTYLAIKGALLSLGYQDEIRWQESVHPKDVDEKQFLAEFAWVVLSTGLNNRVVECKHEELSSIFFYWEADRVSENSGFCREQSLRVFNHPGKINSIISVASLISDRGFSSMKEEFFKNGEEYFVRLPFIGPVTCSHLAKNLGFSISKPDRHLVRIADLLGYASVENMCDSISCITGEQQQVIDIVLWRFASLEPNYLDFFQTKVLSKA